jgi:hypothetical protein
VDPDSDPEHWHKPGVFILFCIRTSWITLFVETCEDGVDDSWPLKTIYDKVKPAIPTQKGQRLVLK